MRTNGEIVSVANALYEVVSNGMDKLVKVRENAVNVLIGQDVGEHLEEVGDMVSAVEGIMGAPTDDGNFLPEFLGKCEYTADAPGGVTITIRSRLRAEVKYNKKKFIEVDADFVKNVGQFYIDCLFEMYYLNQARANLKELNAKIEEICSVNDIPYTFGFEIIPDNNEFVLSITDDHVVFSADTVAAHDISTLGIFRGGDSYEDLICEKAVEELVESLKAAQTTVQLVKSNMKLIKRISGVSTKKRVSKLIRGSYHRQAKYLDKVKAGVGYYNETVTVNGEETEVFALVEKSEDGSLAVILSPFDVKTMFNVDFDVLGALGEQ